MKGKSFFDLKNPSFAQLVKKERDKVNSTVPKKFLDLEKHPIAEWQQAKTMVDCMDAQLKEMLQRAARGEGEDSIVVMTGRLHHLGIVWTADAGESEAYKVLRVGKVCFVMMEQAEAFSMDAGHYLENILAGKKTFETDCVVDHFRVCHGQLDEHLHVVVAGEVDLMRGTEPLEVKSSHHSCMEHPCKVAMQAMSVGIKFIVCLTNEDNADDWLEGTVKMLPVKELYDKDKASTEKSFRFVRRALWYLLEHAEEKQLCRFETGRNKVTHLQSIDDDEKGNYASLARYVLSLRPK